jgi:polyphosphate kinase
MKGSKRPTSWPAIAPTKSRPASRSRRAGKRGSSADSPPRTPAHPFETAEDAKRVSKKDDLGQPGLLLNREVTWLNFNWRVLLMAADRKLPLLERVKFLAIASSNLDEFFMKRIGGLKQQLGAGVHDLSADGRTPRQQIDVCYQMIKEFTPRKRELLSELLAGLADQGIHITSFSELERREQQWLREHYFENIFPLVTPQAIDPAHPFPFVSNLSLNLLVTLHYPKETDSVLARIKVPVGAGIPRFLRVESQHKFVPLEDVMAHNLDLLFPDMELETCEMFRVTRNANTERDEEQADDLLAMIESELRDRKFAPIVRLEVARGMTDLHRGRLTAELGLNEDEDVFEIDGMIGIRDLHEIVALDLPELKDPPHHPMDNPALFEERNIFHVIRDTGSILLHHPYQSFSTSVERFLKEASSDPKVRAIKMTLYRTSAESKVINYLMNAAQNGKQVAVVVELKARFDEEANIRWATRLEEAGIHVTYGVVGLKTHCKVILVVRQDYSGLKRYMHFGTGNYHAGTARLYSDLGMFTNDPALGQDVTELFNYLTTGYKPKRNYQKLLPAPKILKQKLLEKIDREIKANSPEDPGLIQLKMNALEDTDITKALYRAARAGVRVDLLVRDTCRLRPGLPDLSENVRVVSIVDRFLEHARVFYFRNGGDEEYFFGSADCMKRNLESRVESVVPVENPRLRGTLRFMLDVQLNDPCNAWDMQTDGSYVRRVPSDESAKSAQYQLIDWAEKEHRGASRLKRRKARTTPQR